MVLLYVAVGGAAGAVARYGLSGWIHGRTELQFPWGTLVVNVLGSLLIGFALAYLDAARITPEVRALITVGLLGGFTTFSTFSYESVALLQAGAWPKAALYVGGSVLVGIGAVYAGLAGAGLFLSTRG